MLRKKETLTIITPIPGFIPRQLALDILHSHSEVITLNPLVIGHKPIPAPRNAAADEFYSTWYEITERIQYIPGMGKIGSGKLTFKGCFHDMPWGLQTHIYIPMGVDMRNRYRVQGNQPGIEAPEHPELGLEELGAPKEGLYLRTDVELKCNVAMMGFVKAESRKASVEMVNRMIKKAELLDAGLLKAMFEDGRLKTINPADRSNTMGQQLLRQQSVSHQQPQFGAPTSPAPAYNQPYQYPQQQQQQQLQPQPSPTYPQFARPGTSGSQYPQNPYQQQQTPPPGQQQQMQMQNPYQLQQTPPPQHQMQNPNYAPPVPPKTNMQTIPMELPGDYYHPHQQRSPSLHQSQPSPNLGPNTYRSSTASQASSSDPRWSHPQGSPAFTDSQRNSMVSQSGFTSPGLGHPGFAAELAAHNETAEEHRHR